MVGGVIGMYNIYPCFKELESVTSVSLSGLKTVKQHALLIDYLDKCKQASSTIYNLSPMQADLEKKNV